MTRRRQSSTQSGFTIGNLTNLLAIPLLTGAIILIGFYYTTNSTLSRYGDEIKTIKSTVDTKIESDSTARTKIRDDFLSSQIKTNEGISKLDTRLAVAETNQKTANDTLSKIADTLQKITTFPVPRSR